MARLISRTRPSIAAAAGAPFVSKGSGLGILARYLSAGNSRTSRTRWIPSFPMMKSVT
jgi:hypothetical protein